MQRLEAATVSADGRSMDGMEDTVESTRGTQSLSVEHILLSAPGKSEATSLGVTFDEPVVCLKVLSFEEEVAEAEAAHRAAEEPRVSSEIYLPPQNDPIVRTITNVRFDEAFGSPGEAVFFRLNIVEGAQHVIRRQEPNVKYGLALWSKAIKKLLSDSRHASDPTPSATPISVPNIPPVSNISSIVKSEDIAAVSEEQGDKGISPGGQKRKRSFDDDEEEAVKKSRICASNAASTMEMVRSACLALTARDEDLMKEGLGYLEQLSFGVQSASVNATATSKGGTVSGCSSFVYKSGSSLKICGIDFYSYVNSLIISVISRRGQFLGKCVVEFLKQVVLLGAALQNTKSSPSSTPSAASSGGGSLTSSPTSATGVCAGRPPPPPQPQSHLVRTAKTSAILTAISRYFLHNNSGQPAATLTSMTPRPPFAGVVPPLRPMGGNTHLLDQSQSSSSLVLAPTLAANFTRNRPPPPSLAARFLTSRPQTSFTLWSDPRLQEVPDWVVSTLIDMAHRYDGHVVASVDQCWYSCYGAQLDFRLFGFTGLHDVLTNLPGVTLRREGSEFWVQVSAVVMKDAIKQRWPPPAQKPAPGGQIPAEVLEVVAMRARQIHSSMILSSERVPSGICAQLVDLVTRNEGCNIGHIQQQWRKEHNDEGLDFAALGFSKFSDLLQEIPGIRIVKEGSTVTAWTVKPGAYPASAAAIFGGTTVGPHISGLTGATMPGLAGGFAPMAHLLTKPNDPQQHHQQQQQQILMQMLQMQFQLAAMDSLRKASGAPR